LIAIPSPTLKERGRYDESNDVFQAAKKCFRGKSEKNYVKGQLKRCIEVSN